MGATGSKPELAEAVRELDELAKQAEGGYPGAAAAAGAESRDPQDVLATKFKGSGLAYVSALRTGLAMELPGVLAKLVADNNGFGGGVIRVEYGAAGQVLFEAAAGRLSHAADSPRMLPSSLFEIASCTKFFVACAILRYVEGKHLKLSTTLGELFSIGGASVIPAGLLMIGGTDHTASVSILALLTQRAGLPDYWHDPDLAAGPTTRSGGNSFDKAFRASIDKSWTPRELLAYAAKLTLPANLLKELKTPPAATPSSAADKPFLQPFTHYADTNYVVLALVLEKISGVSFAEYLSTQLALPLGLSRTFLSHTAVFPAGGAPAGAGAGGSDAAAGAAAAAPPPAAAAGPASSSSGPQQWATIKTTVPPELSRFCAHRYEGKDSLYDHARQNADWGGGGIVSTAQDMCKLLRSVLLASPAKSGNAAAAGAAAAGAAPTSFFQSQASAGCLRSPKIDVDEGVSYGSGAYLIDGEADEWDSWEEALSHPRLRKLEWFPEEPDWQWVGHDGHGNSFMFAWPRAQIVIAGTLNNLHNDWWPLAEKVIEVVCKTSLQQGVIFFEPPA